MKNFVYIIIFIASLISSTTKLNATPAATGLIPVDWPEHQNIIYDEVMIFPGQKVSLSISGQIDLNHRYWRVRRCKYAGLKCWWEDRESANVVNFNGVGISLQSKGIRNNLIIHSNGENNIQENIFYEDYGKNHFLFESLLKDVDSIDSIADGLKVLGYIPNNSLGNSFTRTPCRGRPPVCSTGRLKLTITSIDNTQRVSYIQSYLNKNIKRMDVLAIKDSRFFDYLLLDRERSIGQEKHIVNLVQTTTQEMAVLLTDRDTRLAGNYIEIAKYLLTLNPDDEGLQNSLNNGILKALTIRKDWGNALELAPKVVQNAYETYENGKRTYESVCNYMEALNLNAIVWREKKALNSLEDISIAVSLIEKGVRVGKEFLTSEINKVENDSCFVGNTTDPQLDLYQRLFDLSIDGGRMMNLVRGEYGLKKAEELLIQAQCYKRSILENNTNIPEC